MMMQQLLSVKRIIVSAFLVLLVGIGVFASGESAIAVSPPTQQSPENVYIHLGNAAGELKFEPNQLEFTAGKRYKLVLGNPSNQKHYFTAKDFADVIWSQKVDAGNVEVKGAIHELELRPGAEAEWDLCHRNRGRMSCTARFRVTLKLAWWERLPLLTLLDGLDKLYPSKLLIHP